MKVVVAHTHYRQRGGEDESVATEIDLLRARGHEVVPFMTSNDDLDDRRRLHNAINTVWNRDTAARMRRLLGKVQPDVLHVHNTFPLMSPSVIHAGHHHGVPVVATLRNYRLTCANALHFRDGDVCTLCLGRRVGWPGVRYACYRGDRAASAVTVASTTTQRLVGTWTRRVDRIVMLSEFARSLLVPNLGLDPGRVVVKPNTVHPDPGMGSGGGDFALFIGRLSPEKGVHTLMRAWRLIPDPPPLLVIGDGPLQAELEDAAPPSVRVLGRRPHSEVLDLVGEAAMLVFPSEWYETFGRVGMEALARGAPVVASDIGAVAELVDDLDAGVRFRPGDADDLAAKVRQLHERITSRPRATREAARASFERRFSPERNITTLEAIYHDVAGL